MAATSSKPGATAMPSMYSTPGAPGPPGLPSSVPSGSPLVEDVHDVQLDRLFDRWVFPVVRRLNVRAADLVEVEASGRKLIGVPLVEALILAACVPLDLLLVVGREILRLPLAAHAAWIERVNLTRRSCTCPQAE